MATGRLLPLLPLAALLLAGCAVPTPAATGPADPLRDADGDGLCDAGERALRLDPARRDSDRDGFRDGDEAAALAAPALRSLPAGCLAAPRAAWAEGLDPGRPDLVVQPYRMRDAPVPGDWLGFLAERLGRIPRVAVHVREPLAVEDQPVEYPVLAAQPRPIHRVAIVQDLLGLDGGFAYGRAEAPGHDAYVASGRLAREHGHRFDAAFKHVLLHELGHNLGLPHAEGDGLDAPRTAMREAFPPAPEDDLTDDEWALAGQRFAPDSGR